MVLSETIQYITILGITIVFSAFALVMHEKPWSLALKIIAGIAWFVMALTQFFFFGGSALLGVPMMVLFMGIGLVYSFSIVMDFQEEKRQRVWGWRD